MFTETTQILAIKKNSVTVKVLSPDQCGGCSAKGACGQGLLSKALTFQGTLDIPKPADSANVYVEGGLVDIGLPESALMGIMLRLYMLPLMLFVLIAFVFRSSSDLISVLISVMAFLGCAYWLRKTNSTAEQAVIDRLVILDPARSSGFIATQEAQGNKA